MAGEPNTPAITRRTERRAAPVACAFPRRPFPRRRARPSTQAGFLASGAITDTFFPRSTRSDRTRLLAGNSGGAARDSHPIPFYPCRGTPAAEAPESRRRSRIPVTRRRSEAYQAHRDVARHRSGGTVPGARRNVSSGGATLRGASAPDRRGRVSVDRLLIDPESLRDLDNLERNYPRE